MGRRQPTEHPLAAGSEGAVTGVGEEAGAVGYREAKAMDRTYTIVLLKERQGGYSVSVPALKGCHTQGDDLLDAFRMVDEAIRLHLESLQAHGDPVPTDVDTIAVELGDAIEASISRVTIREALAVA